MPPPSHFRWIALATTLGCLFLPTLRADSLSESVVLSAGWQLQDVAKVSARGEEISQAGFQPADWYPATVPGTVLTTLVNNKVYPEPLYGEDNRPDKIPESLCRTSYWYRTAFTVPAAYAGRTVWLNFDGINYTAEVWVNGKNLGAIKGAFARGIFNVSSAAKAGELATLAVKVNPQPNPGDPVEHNLARGAGRNGGITAIDGPTFLCSIGWDWIPGIRDRNTGIWRKVFLSASGPVRIQDPLITTDLPLPSLESADIKIQATLKNGSDQPQKGVLKGTFGDVSFQQAVEVPANTLKVVTVDPTTVPALKVKKPKLWWPNGYGPQNLYPVHLIFEIGGVVSDIQDLSIGVREMSYTVPDSENLTLSVNGVPVVCKGGNWGMDEALKRIPRERLEAKVRMHQLANYNMIRNWVGQSTAEDFYDLCDRYGIMIWDEFFQPNPNNGPNPTDLETYMVNCREKIVRFRNHPSIAVWCGRNEGRPPDNINNALQKLMDELEPTRHYQASSTDGRGVKSGGPYRWRTPQQFYKVDAPFKTETGSVSVPTLEAVQAMMPQKDWETINDCWAQHDLGKGAQGGDTYPGELNVRYGRALNLADFVRKAQLMNLEAFRSMYEGRFASLFQPVTGVLTWMSNPAQPSFVWQLYSHDLEPNAALFAARNACEPVHIMLNESPFSEKGSVSGHVMVVNSLGTQLSGAKATVAVYNLDSSIAYTSELKVEAPASAETDLGAVAWPATLSRVHFVKLKLEDRAGQLISENFYWRAAPGQKQGNLADLHTLPVVKLEAAVKREDANGKCLFTVTLRNPSDQIALMTHLQLRRSGSGERVLPVYYSDNYLSLLPKENRSVTVEAAVADLKGDKPLIVLDGWNTDVTPVASGTCDVALNTNAQVANWPVTHIAVKWFDTPIDQIKIQCGGGSEKDFVADTGYEAGFKSGLKKDVSVDVDLSGAPLTTQGLYRNARIGEFAYTFPIKPNTKGYKVRFYFAELDVDWGKEAAKGISGKRLFNVAINEKPMLTDFEIFAAASGMNKAVTIEFTGMAPDSEGNIRIHFSPGSAGVPKINGIEVVPM